MSSPAPRESITAVELTLPSTVAGGGGQTVAAGDKTTFLRTHRGSTGTERPAAETGDRATRRSTMTSHHDDVTASKQPVQQPDHLRVHTGTGARTSRGYIRFPAAGRNSLGVVKMHSRERRAGRTLIWVFAIFVALWLPFFCTNLAYGLCGVRHAVDTTSISNSSLTSTTTTTPVMMMVFATVHKPLPTSANHS